MIDDLVTVGQERQHPVWGERDVVAGGARRLV